MDTHQLADLAINTQLRLDAFWALFLSVNSATLGGLILIERTFTTVEKLSFGAIYASLMGLFFYATYSAQQLMASIYADISKISYAPDQPGYEVVQYFRDDLDSYTLQTHYVLTITIYCVAFMVISAAIFFYGRVETSKPG